ADVLVAQGGEAGGHSGEIGTMVLVPQVVDVAGDTPVVAAGGIADGRGLAAALALGAQGVALGTRLLASTEMAISPDSKRRALEAGAGDAIKDETVDALLPPYNRPAWPCRPRVLHTAFHDEWAGREDELRQRVPELAPGLGADVLAGGGHDIAPFAGQTVGL